jgi:hypothetical protein
VTLSRNTRERAGVRGVNARVQAFRRVVLRPPNWRTHPPILARATGVIPRSRKRGYAAPRCMDACARVMCPRVRVVCDPAGMDTDDARH